MLAKEKFGLRQREVHELHAHFVPFSAQTRMSGVDLDGRELRKGSVDAIEAHLTAKGGALPRDVRDNVDRISKGGGTPLVVTENGRALGVVHLKDIVKGGIKERFSDLRAMGIRTVMITGDNRLTAADSSGSPQHIRQQAER